MVNKRLLVIGVIGVFSAWLAGNGDISWVYLEVWKGLAMVSFLYLIIYGFDRVFSGVNLRVLRGGGGRLQK